MFLYYFNPLKFVKACCMAQDIHYLSKCSVGTWKKKMFCYCWVECPYMSSKFYLLIALSRSLIFLLIFCLVALSVAEKTVLKSLSIIVDFSISFFRIVLYQVWDIEISSMQLAVFPFSTWKIFCYFSLLSLIVSGEIAYHLNWCPPQLIFYFSLVASKIFVLVLGILWYFMSYEFYDIPWQGYCFIYPD